ncbi:MAG TPA: hypothetical protein DCL61_21470, partial [Cyanobacteria bacterium UBA12227]|nr:hypothetical protein [Cyanobacteria bacterium UBA12227]
QFAKQIVESVKLTDGNADGVVLSLWGGGRLFAGGGFDLLPSKVGGLHGDARALDVPRQRGAQVGYSN